MVFGKNANFLAENWQKSQKLVITTSTPDWANFRAIERLFSLDSFLKITEVAKIFRLLFFAEKDVY
jgi:hypothetical protein